MWRVDVDERWRQPTPNVIAVATQSHWLISDRPSVLIRNTKRRKWWKGETEGLDNNNIIHIASLCRCGSFFCHSNARSQKRSHWDGYRHIDVSWPGLCKGVAEWFSYEPIKLFHYFESCIDGTFSGSYCESFYVRQCQSNCRDYKQGPRDGNMIVLFAQCDNRFMRLNWSLIMEINV